MALFTRTGNLACGRAAAVAAAASASTSSTAGTSRRRGRRGEPAAASSTARFVNAVASGLPRRATRTRRHDHRRDGEKHKEGDRRAEAHLLLRVCADPDGTATASQATISAAEPSIRTKRGTMSSRFSWAHHAMSASSPGGP